MKPPSNPITPAGLAALRARYDHLLGSERPRVVEIVSWAANHWLPGSRAPTNSMPRPCSIRSTSARSSAAPASGAGWRSRTRGSRG
ncbi:hypothetical protein J4558_04825 [Leptolyngbya sp. 15MV]|nr:hypothetical protein J4558_04825 [Leptolyngbya sp. 15MV]